MATNTKRLPNRNVVGTPTGAVGQLPTAANVPTEDPATARDRGVTTSQYSFANPIALAAGGFAEGLNALAQAQVAQKDRDDSVLHVELVKEMQNRGAEFLRESHVNGKLSTQEDMNVFGAELTSIRENLEARMVNSGALEKNVSVLRGRLIGIQGDIAGEAAGVSAAINLAKAKTLFNSFVDNRIASVKEDSSLENIDNQIIGVVDDVNEFRKFSPEQRDNLTRNSQSKIVFEALLTDINRGDIELASQKFKEYRRFLSGESLTIISNNLTSSAAQRDRALNEVIARSNVASQLIEKGFLKEGEEARLWILNGKFDPTTQQGVARFLGNDEMPESAKDSLVVVQPNGNIALLAGPPEKGEEEDPLGASIAISKVVQENISNGVPMPVTKGTLSVVASQHPNPMVRSIAEVINKTLPDNIAVAADPKETQKAITDIVEFSIKQLDAGAEPQAISQSLTAIRSAHSNNTNITTAIDALIADLPASQEEHKKRMVEQNITAQKPRINALVAAGVPEDVATLSVLSRGQVSINPQPSELSPAELMKMRASLTDTQSLESRISRVLPIINKNTVGLKGWLSAKPGGVIQQIPLVNSMANALGVIFDKKSVKQAQVARSEFEKLILASARFLIGHQQRLSNQQFERAQEVLKLTQLGTIEEAAVESLQGILDDVINVRKQLTRDIENRRITLDPESEERSEATQPSGQMMGVQDPENPDLTIVTLPDGTTMRVHTDDLGQ